METPIEELGKVSITVEKDFHNINKEYSRLTIVEINYNIDNYTIGNCFISRKYVPENINITDREYWIPLRSDLNIIELYDYIKNYISRDNITLIYKDFNGNKMIKSNGTTNEIYSPNGTNQSIVIYDNKLKLYSTINKQHLIELGNEINIKYNNKSVFKANSNSVSVQYEDEDIIRTGNLGTGIGTEIKIPKNVNPIISAYSDGVDRGKLFIQYPLTAQDAIEINSDNLKINFKTNKLCLNGNPISNNALYDLNNNKFIYLYNDDIILNKRHISDSIKNVRLSFKENNTEIFSAYNENSNIKSYISIYNENFGYNNNGINFVGNEFRFNGILFNPNNKNTVLYNQTDENKVIIKLVDNKLLISDSSVDLRDTHSIINLTEENYSISPNKLSNTNITQATSKDFYSVTSIKNATNINNVEIICKSVDESKEAYIEFIINNTSFRLDEETIEKLKKLLSTV